MFKFPTARILLFTREPVAGRVKTRLHGAIGAQSAYELHCAMLKYQVSTLRRARLAPWEIWVSGNENNPFFTTLGDEAERFRQQGADLGQRMRHAAEVALARASAVVLIGTDCPSIDSDYLEQALALLDGGVGTVVGPAEDGGYVLLGLRDACEALFDEVPWGSSGVLALTLDRLARSGRNFAQLATRWDVDRPEDLARLAELQPPLDYQLPESGKSDSN